MRKALVLSVPGTGSRFTLNFLESCLGYERISPDDLLHKPPESPFCALQHVNAATAALKRAADPLHELKTVIPLRHPVHQFLTRLGVNSSANRVREECKSLWSRLRSLVGDFDYVFLPIEEDIDRLRRLNAVMRHLDASPNPGVLRHIVTHWTPVGSGGIKPERIRYDTDGDVMVGGFSMRCFDGEVEWYVRQVAAYRDSLSAGE